MQLLKRRHFKISSVTDKIMQWQQELVSNISKVYNNYKESLFYFILKSWLIKENNSSQILFVINNSSFNLNPEEDFFILNKTTWYSIKGKLKVKQIPIRKIGYYCYKKLVFVFDNYCYFFYKDKNLDRKTIYEGYLNFINKQNIEKILHLLETNEINHFFVKINANTDLYRQILYYKGNTFELVLKKNVQNRTFFNEQDKNKEKVIYKKITLNQNNHEKSKLTALKKNNLFRKSKKHNINNSNDSNISEPSKLRNNNSAENLTNILLHSQSDISIIINKSLIRDRSCIDIQANSLRKKLDKIPEHFPNRKLSKSEDEKLNKILKAVIHYYCFYKNFNYKLNLEQEVNDLNLCMINKDWLNKFFINKFNFYRIKEYLNKKYEEIDPMDFLEYKELLIKACRIKDFLLVQTQPILPLQKDFTEFGDEYFENYELIDNNCYQIFKETFGSYELDEIRIFKINIIKYRGIIINYKPNQVEISKQYMDKNNKSNNNKKNTKPERYLIVLKNSKYMNFRIKRPLEENGITEGIKLIPTEQNEEDYEEYFKIKLNKEIIGSLINITNPVNKSFGNFIPSQPCLLGIEKNDVINSLNSILQCLNNIKSLIGFFLNKKRMKQISIQKEKRPFSYELLQIFKDLWLNETKEKKEKISAKKLSEYLLKMNPFFSQKKNNAIEILYFIINLLHKEMNTIENINTYVINNKIRFNYQLCFETFYNYYKSNYKSIISDVFYGFKNDTITCSNCFNTSHSINIYDKLNFLPDDIRIFKAYSNTSILIEEGFEYNERKIEYYYNKDFFCNFCNNYANGVFCTKLISVPKCLIINLERKEEKDFYVNVIFEEFLNLTNFAFYDSNNYLYELIGVITNVSKFDEDKKYISFCKSSTNKMWYLYNDATVNQIEFKDIKNIGNVNILIYHHCIDNK